MEKIENTKNDINIREAKTDGLYAFFEKNRKPLFISCAIILVLLASLIAVLLVSEAIQKNETAKLDALAERYDKIKDSLKVVDGAVENGGEDPVNTSADAGEIEALLNDLRSLGESASGYPAARAWFMAANIYHERGEWQEAQDAWLAAAAKGASTHLSPVCLFNAAVVGETQGDTDSALQNYQHTLSFEDFPAAAHAQFSVGRLEEKKGDNEAAIAAYRAVIEKWPADTDWVNLAHSRILALEIIADGQ
jgi:tetratricopeptide (TPR) repeat protein